MTRKNALIGRLLGAGGAATALIVALGPVASAGASQSASVTQYVMKDTSKAVSGLGPGNSVVPGTATHIAGQLVQSGKQVGLFIFACTAETGGDAAEAECTGTMWIGSGWNQVNFAGYKLVGSSESVFSVTGGTGNYLGVRGQLTTAQTSTNGVSDVAVDLVS